MISLLKKPLFWTNVFALIFSGWLIADLVFGWNNPLIPPPGGSAAITVDASRNVGIGITPAAKLHVGGDTRWGTRGRLTTDQGASIELGGSGTPYIDFINDSSSDYDARIMLLADNTLRIEGADLSVNGGDIIANAGISLGGVRRTAWPSGGGSGTVTEISAGSGIALSSNPITDTGSVSVNTAIIQQRVSGTCASDSAMRIINQNGTVTCQPLGTLSGDLIANFNVWGTQVSNRLGSEPPSGATQTGGSGSSNINVRWGRTADWELQCPNGYYLIGIGQDDLAGGYPYANPYIICAQL